jgi:DNA repair exonuclease SbcCD ATPase subunit
MTKNELSAKLDAFEAALAAYGVSKFTAKDIWELRAEITEDFRAVTFADAGERQEAWQRLQDGMDMLKQKGALMQVENEAFASEAEERIEMLQRLVDDAVPEKEWSKDELAALRGIAGELFEFLRQNRWPSRERRETVWDRFTAARDRIKKLDDARYERVRAGIREREERSAVLALPLKAALEACLPEGNPEDLLPAYTTLRAAFEAQGLAAGTFDFLEKAFAEKTVARAPLKLKSDMLRELRRLFTEHRQQFSKEDGQATYALFTSVQKEIDAAWNVYKGERQKKQDEWVEKQKAFLKMLEEKLQKRHADGANLEKVIAAKQDFGPRLEARLASQQDYLNKLYDDLDELQVKYEGARSFDMRERMESAIEGKRVRIAEIESDLKSIGQRIEINNKDIAEIRSKVSKISEAASEIEQKIAEVQQRKTKGA